MPIESIQLEKIKSDTTLRKLKLSHRQLNDNDIQQLVNALASNTNITSLKVSYNQIGASGAQALASNTTLTSLDIYRNQIGNKGAQALACNSHLISLNIGYNEIGDEGAQAFLNNTTLTKLDIYNNPIGIQWEEKLKKVLLDNEQRPSLLRRNQFLRVLIILMQDLANPTSQSHWAKLPKEIALHIISLMDFTSLDSIGKSRQQIYRCAVFIFNHMAQLRESLAEAYQSKQIVKIIEIPPNPTKIEFRFFPCKPQPALETKKEPKSFDDVTNLFETKVNLGSKNIS